MKADLDGLLHDSLRADTPAWLDALVTERVLSTVASAAAPQAASHEAPPLAPARASRRARAALRAHVVASLARVRRLPASVGVLVASVRRVLWSYSRLGIVTRSSADWVNRSDG